MFFPLLPLQKCHQFSHLVLYTCTISSHVLPFFFLLLTLRERTFFPTCSTGFHITLAENHSCIIHTSITSILWHMVRNFSGVTLYLDARAHPFINTASLDVQTSGNGESNTPTSTLLQQLILLKMLCFIPTLNISYFSVHPLDPILLVRLKNH